MPKQPIGKINPKSGLLAEMPMMVKTETAERMENLTMMITETMTPQWRKTTIPHQRLQQNNQNLNEKKSMKMMKTMRPPASQWNSLILIISVCLLSVSVSAQNGLSAQDVKNVMKMPTLCESCEIFSRDFGAKAMAIPLKLPTGESEALFLDLTEGFCDQMLHYKLHVDKKGIDRFQPEQSPILRNLQKMHKSGTTIKTDVPLELWDLPTIETDRLKRDCEFFLEEKEELLEEWFTTKRSSEPNLSNVLCRRGKRSPCSPDAPRRAEDDL